MRFKNVLRAALVALGLSLAGQAVPAAAITITWTQAGWYDPLTSTPVAGTLVFTVTATELQPDGILNNMPGVSQVPVDLVTAARVTWTGPGAFTLDLTAVLFDFSYAYGPNVFGLLVGDTSLVFLDIAGARQAITFGSQLGAFGRVFADRMEFWSFGPIVAQVPAPAGLALFALGLAALTLSARRRAA